MFAELSTISENVLEAKLETKFPGWLSYQVVVHLGSRMVGTRLCLLGGSWGLMGPVLLVISVSYLGRSQSALCQDVKSKELMTTHFQIPF